MKKQGYKGLLAVKVLCMMAVGLILGTGFFQTSARAASDYVIKINKQANCVTIYRGIARGRTAPAYTEAYYSILYGIPGRTIRRHFLFLLTINWGRQLPMAV